MRYPIAMTTALPRERTTSFATLISALEANVARVIRGKPQAIATPPSPSSRRGHLLIEDVPGVGKTTLARAVATSIGGTFHRIQFTSDLLPSDIVGVSVLDQSGRSVRVSSGPDLREPGAGRRDRSHHAAHAERAARGDERRAGSVDGQTYPLDSPFMVIATQNPAEHYGTYPLPESQMDRFLLRIRIDYPSPEDERLILMETPGARATRWPSSNRCCGSRMCARCRKPPSACTSRSTWPTTSWRWRARRGGRRTWRWACRRADSWPGATPRAPWR